MLKDIRLSSELNQDFKQTNPYPIYVKVVTQAIWPTYSTTSLALPLEVHNPILHVMTFLINILDGKNPRGIQPILCIQV